MPAKNQAVDLYIGHHTRDSGYLSIDFLQNLKD